LLSGSTAKGVVEFGQNLANTTFGNYRNSLANIAGLGQQANQAISGAGQNYANATNNNAFNVASAQGAASQGNANAFGNIAGLGAGYLLQGGFGGGNSAVPAIGTSTIGGGGGGSGFASPGGYS
jgi:hypothetical protein